MKTSRFLTIMLLLYFSNSYLFALAYNPKKSFNDGNTSIEVLSKNIKPGQTFKIKVSSKTEMDDKAWLGIFKPNLNQKDPSGYYSYAYVGSKNGKEIEMKAPVKNGEYELRLYAADPGDFVKAIVFNVVNVKPSEYTITILTERIKPSQEFNVKIETTFETDPHSWLGIFKSDLDSSNAQGYSSYVYVTKPYGENLTLTAPGEPGNYELRFYSADPGALIAQIPFRIGELSLPGIAFTLNKEAYGPEEEITINYIGHEDLAETAWIGLFKSGDEYKSYSRYLNYYYLRPKAKGEFKFKAPSSKGNYEARMFYAETGPELLTPVPFTVTSSLDDITIKKALNENGKIALYGIYFDTDKSIVKTESYPLIKEIAKMLNGDPSIKIRVEGHTDAQGDDSYNQDLSQKRAQAVVKILTSEYNAKEAQLESVGYGETKPIDNNNTAEGRAKNRRVELKKL